MRTRRRWQTSLFALLFVSIAMVSSSAHAAIVSPDIGYAPDNANRYCFALQSGLVTNTCTDAAHYWDVPLPYSYYGSMHFRVHVLSNSHGITCRAYRIDAYGVQSFSDSQSSYAQGWRELIMLQTLPVTSVETVSMECLVGTPDGANAAYIHGVAWYI
jgi:hypothetical protein